MATEVWLPIGTTAVLAWGQPASSPGPSNQAPYTLPVNSRNVLTDVPVTDKPGNPIAGLTENDFPAPRQLGSWVPSTGELKPK